MSDEPYTHETKCLCGTDVNDHAVKFHFWPDDVWPEFTISTSLNHYHGFWKRVWIGIKYALGIDNTHYFYTEQTLSPEEFVKLQVYINNVANRFTSYEEDDGPLTDEQIEAIRAASLATDTPRERFTRTLFPSE